MRPVLEGLIAGLALPPDYTVSQWADMHVILAPEMAAEAGRWRTSRAPYQREMMDVQTDPAVDVIVYKTSAQVGKTSCLLNGIGYHIHHAPVPMLMIQPDLGMAEAFSKDKLAPLLRDTPVLAERVAEERSRTSSNTIHYKQFPGGHLTIVGANSPTALRMRSVKLVWADEIDAYPYSAGEEGDPLKLARKRTMTFFGSKLICSSTPTLKGLSRVDDLWEKSDKRHLFVPCPDCGHHQILKWENVTWTKGRPETAGYACEACGTVWSDADIKRQIRHCEWRATAPFNRIAGFHVWQAYSPWSTLANIVAEYEESEGKSAERQVWTNTVLGEVWDGDERANVTAQELYERRESFTDVQVPERAVVLTAGVDIQSDRIEVMIVAYGANNESWVLTYQKIIGDPASDTPWRDLTDLMLVRLPHPTGRMLGIEAVACDSGYHTQRVYDWSNRNFVIGRRWYAIKGVAGEGRTAWEQSKVRIKGGAKLYNVGVDTLKSEIYSQLGNRSPGADFIHFPNSEPFTMEFFEGLTCERVRTVLDARGFPHREWYKPPHSRNEPLDLKVYADAAHKSLNINHKERLASMFRQRPTANAGEIARLFKG